MIRHAGLDPASRTYSNNWIPAFHYVDGIHLDAGSVDVTGIQIGDVVEVTYLKMKYAKFVQSIEVLEPVEGKRLPKKEPLREPAKAVEKGGCLLKR